MNFLRGGTAAPGLIAERIDRLNGFLTFNRAAHPRTRERFLALYGSEQPELFEQPWEAAAPMAKKVFEKFIEQQKQPAGKQQVSADGETRAN